MTQGEVEVMLELAADAYDKPIKEGLVTAWMDFFGKVTFLEGMAAMRMHIEQYPRFPTVADIRMRLQELHETPLQTVVDDEQRGGIFVPGRDS